jgi:hypothetical protein
MCTMIVEKAQVSGSGRGSRGWFEVNQANVSFDHPLYTPLEYAVNIDFVNEDMGLDARVAVELSPESARRLMEAISAALARGEAEVGLQ